MRRTALLVARRCLQVSAAPTSIALLLAGAGSFFTAQHGEAVAAAHSVWLHLPAFVAAATCCLGALAAWPTFARARPGADWVARPLGPGLRGCGAATLGALLALLLWLSVLALLFAPLSPPPQAHRRLAPPPHAVLDEAHAAVAFAGGGAHADAVLLRPIALLSLQAPEPTQVMVLVDGRAITTQPLPVTGTRQLLRVGIGGPVGELAVVRTAGNLTLLFPPGSVELVLSGAHSALANTWLGLQLYLLPAAVALALAALLAPLLALPVNATTVLAALLLLTLGRAGPTGDGIAALLRGRWLPSEPLFQTAWQPAFAAAALLLLARLCHALRP